MEQYLSPTYYIDSDHPRVAAFALQHGKTGATDMENAVSLYYAVRDSIPYNPFSLKPLKERMRASSILQAGQGYCVAKAVLLAACARAFKIPARLGFADVRNHLTTKKLRNIMETDLFIYHGYTDLFLNNRWVKATPAFNRSLCEKFNIAPLEFDGTEDSIFHPFDNLGKRHMEYVTDHGVFSDLPWEKIITESMKLYPLYFQDDKMDFYDFSA
jgi:transglutaminase-like putative cysteine protease